MQIEFGMVPPNVQGEIVLRCGDRLPFFVWGTIRAPKAGDYYSCENHSEVVGYDPVDGDPVYERDQQAVEVITARPA